MAKNIIAINPIQNNNIIIYTLMCELNTHAVISRGALSNYEVGTKLRENIPTYLRSYIYMIETTYLGISI